MGSPQDPRARAKQKRRRRVKEERLREKALLASVTKTAPAESSPKALEQLAVEADGFHGKLLYFLPGNLEHFTF